MDFKDLSKKLGDFTSKAIESGKEAYSKTTDFTYENLRKTGAVMKNGADFESVRSVKKLVVFTIGKDDPVSKEILVQLPILYAKAWIASASLRFVFAEESGELVSVLDLPVPGVAFYRLAERQFVLSGENVTEFLKTFDLGGNAPDGNGTSIVEDATTASTSTETAEEASKNS